jgi:hypothetical protein
MPDITIEQADYIIAYYPGLMNLPKKKALRHHVSTLKLEDAKNERLTRMYLKTGWLSDDPMILNYLSEGYIPFVLNLAASILKETPDKVFFNLCLQCGKLVRHRRLSSAGFAGLIGIKGDVKLKA